MSISRVMLAGLAGAGAGASFVAAWYFIGMMEMHGIAYALKYGPRNSFGIFVMALVIWLVGLVVVGGPFWWLLHRLNRRGWVTAVLLGLSLTFFVSFMLTTNGFGLLSSGNGSFSAGDSGGQTWLNGELTAHGWHQAFWGSLWFSLSGACPGFVTWWVAYRRA